MNRVLVESFLAIVEMQSLTKAAEKLYITQSAISNRLIALENTLGVQLVQREQGKRQITLTQKGVDFIPIAMRLTSLEKEIDSWVSSDSYLSLKIGAVDSLNSYVLPPLYKNVISNEPLSLNISSHWTNTLYALLESHEIDFGITTRLYKSETLIGQPIFKEKMVMVSNTNSSQYKEFVRTSDLDVEKELLLDWGPDYHLWHDKWWSPNSRINLRLDTSALIFSCLDVENSWAVVPESVAYHFQRIYPIKISQFDTPPPNRTSYKILNRYPSSNRLEAIRTFETALDEFLKDHPYLIQIKGET